MLEYKIMDYKLVDNMLIFRIVLDCAWVPMCSIVFNFNGFQSMYSIPVSCVQVCFRCAVLCSGELVGDERQRTSSQISSYLHTC